MNSDVSEGGGQQGGQISRWAISLDAVLADNLGLAAFASFLRKEYADENLQFWIECKRKRRDFELFIGSKSV